MNRTQSAVVGRMLVVFVASIFNGTAIAQMGGTVVESQGFTPGPQAQVSSQNSSSNNDGLSLLLDQNQQLRSEVQALRGLVEEQSFEIRKLQRDSLTRYTNVDERLSALESTDSIPPQESSDTNRPSSFNSPGSISSVSNTTTLGASPSAAGVTLTGESPNENFSNNSSTDNNSIAAPQSSIRSTARGTLQPAVLSEQQLYQMAYDSVINSNFERSIAEFDQYLNVYPDGRFVTNAYYWKGQAFLYLNRFNEAKDSYEIIVVRYEDSAKLADAMYGLGLAYQGLGNIPQARQILNEIKRRFPNTGVANLADTRLLQLD